MKKKKNLTNKEFLQRPFLISLALVYTGVWLWSSVRPVNKKDWMLENVLVFTSLFILVKSYKKIPFSNKSYALLFVFFVLHSVGAHYTYSEVPLFNWMRDAYHLKRNHYDRIVHFLFGFLILFPLSEVFVKLKKTKASHAKLFSLLIISYVSVSFEIVEAITARIVAPDLGAAYLGAQGDESDAERDILCAVSGALLAMLVSDLTVFERLESRSVSGRWWNSTD